MPIEFRQGTHTPIWLACMDAGTGPVVTDCPLAAGAFMKVLVIISHTSNYYLARIVLLLRAVSSLVGRVQEWIHMRHARLELPTTNLPSPACAPEPRIRHSKYPTYIVPGMSDRKVLSMLLQKPEGRIITPLRSIQIPIWRADHTVDQTLALFA